MAIVCLESQFSSESNVNYSLTVNGHNRPTPREGKPPLPEPEEHFCLIRATSKSQKLSTVVKKHDVPKVMESYARIMKISMDGLKKVKKVKSKAKAAQG